MRQGLALLALALSVSVSMSGVAPLMSVAAENASPLSNPIPAADSELQQQREQEVVVPAGTVDEAIVSVQSSGIMGGYPDGQFHADRPLSRGELASILVKAFHLKDRKPTQLEPVNLKDVPANYWAADDIKTVVEQGVMTGYRDGYFYPNQRITRGEALAIFAQAYGVQQIGDNTVDTILSRYPDSAQVPEWGRKAMVTSLKNGFVDTMPSQKIRPQQPMTRGSMAFALNQYLKRLNATEQQVLP